MPHRGLQILDLATHLLRRLGGVGWFITLEPLVALYPGPRQGKRDSGRSKPFQPDLPHHI